MAHPARYVHLSEARARFGQRVDTLAPKFLQGDPLADEAVKALATRPHAEGDALLRCLLDGGLDALPAAPEPLRALVAEVSRVPFWLDDERLARAGAAFLRSGLLGGLVLGSYSLILGYCSPAGNKPLALSGRLEKDAARRLGETSRFVQAVTSPHGLRRFGDGFKITVRVRLMHAGVRRILLASEAWQTDSWGLPINQVDMAGTILLFSLVLQDGLAKLGLAPTLAEREDLLHLWRYVAYLMGVCDELRCATLAEARTLWDLIATTQESPDEDSRILARALLESPAANARTSEERRRAKASRPVAYALSRHLLGDRLADSLGYPRTSARWGIKALEQVNRRAPWLLRVIPGLPFGSVDAGMGYWTRVVGATLAGAPATFSIPPDAAFERAAGSPLR